MDARIKVHPPKMVKKNDYYITVSYYINGKRKQVRRTHIGSSKEAKEAGEEIKKDLEKRMPYLVATTTKMKTLTLSQMWDEYYTLNKKKISLGTVKIRKASIKRTALKDSLITDIDLLAIDTEIARLSEIFAYNTVKNTVESINVVLNAAVTYHYTQENPGKGTNLQEPDQDPEKIFALPINECFALLGKVKRKDAKLLTLMGFTLGLRVGEVLNIHPTRDIDEINGTLTVRGQVTRTEDGGYLRNQKPKTKNSYRTLPIPSVTMEAIRAYNVRTTDGYLFPPSCSGTSTRMSLLFERCGYDITYHTLRHCYITNLIANGIDVQSVAKLAGDTVQTILKTYSHYLKETEAKNKDKISQIFQESCVEVEQEASNTGTGPI